MYVPAVAFLAHLLSDISRHWMLSAFLFVILAPIAWVLFIRLRGRRRRRRVMEVAVAGNLKAPTSYLEATQRVGRKKSRRGGALLLGGFLGIVLFGLFGGWLMNPLVFHNGETGEGIVTGEYRTNDMWNNEPVIGFNVVIRKADGGIVQTRFRSDSFNVYPPANAVRYPTAGMRFTVRYLPAHPADFVIVTNDNSEWARSLRCGDLLQALASAARAASFAPGDSSLAQARETALAAARAGGCIPGGN
jgi:hypothetical protein